MLKSTSQKKKIRLCNFCKTFQTNSKLKTSKVRMNKKHLPRYLLLLGMFSIHCQKYSGFSNSELEYGLNLHYNFNYHLSLQLPLYSAMSKVLTSHFSVVSCYQLQKMHDHAVIFIVIKNMTKCCVFFQFEGIHKGYLIFGQVGRFSKTGYQHAKTVITQG